MMGLQETLSSGFQRSVELTFLRQDGTTFIVELNTALLRDANGEPSGFIATTRDITDRKMTEYELQRLNVELEGYAHTVSHDLRGPLAAINVASLTIQRILGEAGSTGSNPQIIDIAMTIENNVDKANTLIENMLVHAETGQKPTSVFKIDVSSVAEQVLEEMEPQLEERKVRVLVDQELGQVVANRTQIYQVFSNLIRNAVLHNDSESPEVSVSYLGDDSTGGHRYLVRDNGSGIPVKDLDSIFLPFFKGETGGTGIGLSTVKKIVERLGGEISAYNDNGACFELTLLDQESD